MWTNYGGDSTANLYGFCRHSNLRNFLTQFKLATIIMIREIKNKIFVNMIVI